MKRVVIYPKDIMLLTGKSERYSRDILKKIKSHFNKLEYQCVTVSEFCIYMGLNEELIQSILK
jgi:hypothetical protein